MRMKFGDINYLCTKSRWTAVKCMISLPEREKNAQLVVSLGKANGIL